jgi:transposase-like protein
MVFIPVRCPHCNSDDIIKGGKTKAGIQRYKCLNTNCSHYSFQLDLLSKGRCPAIKEQIIDMALNGSGIRDTARVLKISPTTVINALKKTRVANLTREQYNGLSFSFLRVQKVCSPAAY